MNYNYEDPVQLIPIDEINVVNTRSRGRVKFKEIVTSIKKLGLKKPITVAPASGKHGPGKYDLACGQGRLLAYSSLGEKTIPARIQNLSEEDLFLTSLIENLARRKIRSIELLEEIAVLKKRGYTISQIAKKTALSIKYVSGVLRLLKHGERKLLSAVENRQLPLSVAIEIAAADDEGIQKALHEAYSQKLLRGKKLINVRGLIEKRRSELDDKNNEIPSKQLTSHSILQAYRKETARQQSIVKQAQLCQRQLLYITSAMKRLFADDNFVNLLRLEALDSLPQYLADQIL